MVMGPGNHSAIDTRLWYNQGTIWKDWGKRRKFSVKIAGVVAETRTENLSNMSLGGLPFRRCTRIYFSRVSVILRSYVAKAIILLQEPVGWPGARWCTNSSQLRGNDSWTKEVVNSNSLHSYRLDKSKQLDALYEKFRIFKNVLATIMFRPRPLMPMSELAP
jgi:hypothetical protein